MRVPTRRLAALLPVLLLAVTAPSVAAVTAPIPSPPPQSAEDETIEMPDNLRPFWDDYYEAKLVDDEEEMDAAVRRRQDLAEASLDILLDDLSAVDRRHLHGELRTLAWSMDRVVGQERFIERVRLVLDMELGDRRRRHHAVLSMIEGQELFANARSEKSEESWERASQKMESAIKEFASLGDDEHAIYTLTDLSELERFRGRPWERSKVLQRIGEHGERLTFDFVLVSNAKIELDNLLEAGVDPDGERPSDADLPEELTAEIDDGSAGQGLTAWASGSSDALSSFEYVLAKKGLSGVTLPSYYPADNYLLWPQTWIDGIGPSEMDSQRVNLFKPDGKIWGVRRDGGTFFLDLDGSGDDELEFTPNTSPKLVEVPREGADPLGMLFSIPGDREQFFGIEVNYAPQPTGARMRFNISGYMEGEALGQSIRLYDTNLTGAYGDVFETHDDLYTEYTEDDHISTIESDSVRIGKSKKAIPWSTVLPVGDAFYRATVKPDGTELTLRELNLQTGSVKLKVGTKIKPTHVVIREIGKLEGAYFDVVGPKLGKEVKVPAGKYKLVFGRLETGKKTSMDQVRIYSGKSAEFEIAEGETYELELGAPFDAQVTTRQDGDEFVVDMRTMRLFGTFGEEYACVFDEAFQPQVDVRGADGKMVEKGMKTRAADIEAWQKNTGRDNVLWFPQELRVDNADKAKLQVRLSQKSHRLLGGPLESEWIE